jgi:hypothetical protein
MRETQKPPDTSKLETFSPPNLLQKGKLRIKEGKGLTWSHSQSAIDFVWAQDPFLTLRNIKCS